MYRSFALTIIVWICCLQQKVDGRKGYSKRDILDDKIKPTNVTFNTTAVPVHTTNASIVSYNIKQSNTTDQNISNSSSTNSTKYGLANMTEIIQQNATNNHQTYAVNTTVNHTKNANTTTSAQSMPLSMNVTDIKINDLNSTQKDSNKSDEANQASIKKDMPLNDTKTGNDTTMAVKTIKNLVADVNNTTDNATAKIEATRAGAVYTNSSQKEDAVVRNSTSTSTSTTTSTSTAKPTQKLVTTTTSLSTPKPTKSDDTNAWSKPQTESDEDGEVDQVDEVEKKQPSSARWSVLYEQLEVRSNKSRAMISHYVKFKQFECGRESASEAECECVSMNVSISIAGQLNRRLFSLKCHKILNHFRFGILPGIEYDFALSPNIKLNGAAVAVKPQTFTVFEPVPLEVVSFQLSSIVMPGVVHQINPNVLFQSLTQQISELTGIGPQLISVFMNKRSNSGAKRLSIVIIIGTKANSSRAQLGIEKIRNLYFDLQDQRLSVVPLASLAEIIRKSTSIEISSVTLHDTQTIHGGERGEWHKSTGYGLSAQLFFICALLLITYVLCKLNAPNKLESLKNVCMLGGQRFVIVMHDFWLWVKPQITNVRATLNSSRLPSQAMESRYTVLRMSEDPEDRAYQSGIKLLNEIFEQENVAPFQRQQYIAEFSEHWITKIEQLQQLNAEDYRRFSIPVNLQNAIIEKLADIEQKNDVRDDDESRKRKEKFLRQQTIYTDDLNSEFSDF